jgi:hypothetical protein
MMKLPRPQLQKGVATAHCCRFVAVLVREYKYLRLGIFFPFPTLCYMVYPGLSLEKPSDFTSFLLPAQLSPLLLHSRPDLPFIPVVLDPSRLIFVLTLNTL